MRRPWNIVDTPVYSLVTYREGNPNMNICTYVTPISRKPKLYSISIEQRSKTELNLESSNLAVLQILSKDQASLVRILGKKSGHLLNKHEWLLKRKLLLYWRSHLVLENCIAYMLLKKTRSCHAGDHLLFLFEVVGHQTVRDSGILMLQDLIDQRIILA